MNKTISLVVGVFCLTHALASQTTPLSESLLKKRVFKREKINYTPIDIQNYEWDIHFVPNLKNNNFKAKLTFKAVANGIPYFVMEPSIKSIKLNGVSVKTITLPAPDNHDSHEFIAIQSPVIADQVYELEIDYIMPRSQFSWFTNGVGFLTSMTDVTDWHFLNAYAPANFEADQYPMTLKLQIENSDATPVRDHQLFVNGKIVDQSPGKWTVQFPEYYNASSIYLHITANSGIKVNQHVFKGRERDVPITLYSRNSSYLKQASAQILKLFTELESTFGPYQHDTFIAYVDKRSGGMEHCGATYTSVGALDHELLHSWFARGVMPGEGRSGWIDEGIASWRDYGYKRGKFNLEDEATLLSPKDYFRFSSPSNSYSDGREMFSKIHDLTYKLGGLKPILKEFYMLNRMSLMTTEMFLSFIQSKVAYNLKPFFTHYVYGDNEDSIPKRTHFVDAEYLKYHSPIDWAEVKSAQ